MPGGAEPRRAESDASEGSRRSPERVRAVSASGLASGDSEVAKAIEQSFGSFKNKAVNLPTVVGTF